MKKNKFWAKLPILITSLVFMGAFTGLIIYLCTYVNENETVLINNSYNSRQEILLSRNYRGTIFSRDGDVLADTKLDHAQNETREYPYGHLFSHVVGYDINGRMGVEALANYYLINSHISVSSKVNNDLAGLKNPGDNVYTTLDVELQRIADQYLNVYQGAVVVTEVETGKILAMVSHPDFDPSKIEENWDTYLKDTSSSVLLNRATQGQYPPGSTFKIATALEYYKENPSSWNKYSFTCNGKFTLDGNTINCYHKTNHGYEDFTKSFAKSCNSSFAKIGTGLDQESFQDTLNKLLFNQDLPLSTVYSKSKIADLSALDSYALMQTSIGQGTTTISPMHLNMITCAIANGGVLMKPYTIDYIENAEGSVYKTFKPESYGKLMSEDEAAFLTTLMTEVVKSGTATKLKGLSYTAAGKTGSAEFNNVKGDSHAWFTGFAPVEDPKVAVTIIIEGAGSGGEYAVPLAKRLFDSYFEQASLETP